MSLFEIVLVLGAGAVAFAIGAFAVPARRPHCPSCKTTLESEGASVLVSRQPDGKAGYIADHFRCPKCKAEWRSGRDGGLLDKEQFDAGARDAIPSAKIIDEGT